MPHVHQSVVEAGRLCRGPSDLRLLPHFGGHMACRIWIDADV